VTFEDGRKGKISATVNRRCRPSMPVLTHAGGCRMNARDPTCRAAAEERRAHPRRRDAEVDNVSLSFGGVKAITDVSFDIAEG
jgi:hypothetical protein